MAQYLDPPISQAEIETCIERHFEESKNCFARK